jgi:hypothetical protein
MIAQRRQNRANFAAREEILRPEREIERCAKLTQNMRENWHFRTNHGARNGFARIKCSRLFISSSLAKYFVLCGFKASSTLFAF